MTETVSPESKHLTPDLIDEAVRVYRAAWAEADELLSLDPLPEISAVDPRDRYAMFSLLTWLKT